MKSSGQNIKKWMHCLGNRDFFLFEWIWTWSSFIVYINDSGNNVIWRIWEQLADVSEEGEVNASKNLLWKKEWGSLRDLLLVVAFILVTPSWTAVLVHMNCLVHMFTFIAKSIPYTSETPLEDSTVHFKCDKITGCQ